MRVSLSVCLSVLLFHRDIDKVDDLMADITEQQEVAQEISDVISRPIGFGQEFDEVRMLKLRNLKYVAASFICRSRSVGTPLCISPLGQFFGNSGVRCS